MSGASPQPDRTTAGALALQRVLALEGRNALSRVELAASELSRFGLVPGALERIGAIREAVGELDALLDKIERLADPARARRSGERTALEAAWRAVRARIEPVLATRDIGIEFEEETLGMPVRMPGVVVERLLLLVLRTAVAAIERDRAGEAEATPSTLCISGRRAGNRAAQTAAGPEGPSADDAGGDPGDVELTLRALRGGTGLRLGLERAERVELEVALAEWHAAFALTEDAQGTRLRVGLPGVERDAD